MKNTFRKQLFRVSLVLISGFMVLFIFRIIYGYTNKSSDREDDYLSNFFQDFRQSRKNYASDNFKFEKVIEGKNETTNQNNELNVSQKYEKTATLTARTQQFDKDEAGVKKTIKKYNAIIQYEENRGNSGSRELHLLIGVLPSRFDTFYVEIQKAGNIRSKQITKTDKTNEYLKLNAKKNSLETIRTSLLELKLKSGQIDEFINLQNRILEVEKELQDLGVLLGNFDKENEFCTVRFSLIEGKLIPVSFMHRIKVAFEWSVKYYLQLIISGLVAVFVAYLLLLVIDKTKLLSVIVKRLNS